MPCDEQRGMHDDADALVAVVAHGLLNAIIPAVGAADLLAKDDLAPATQRDMVAMIQRRLGVVVGTLQDLVRGIPMDVLDMLDDVPRARA